MPVSLFPAEMHEQSAVVLGVFLDPVIQGLDLFLIEEPENPLLELARPFTGNDLDPTCPPDINSTPVADALQSPAKLPLTPLFSENHIRRY